MLQEVRIQLFILLVFLSRTVLISNHLPVCMYTISTGNRVHFDASVGLYPSRLPGLTHQDRPYLLMICVWTCTKIQPEIDGFSSLQRVRIPSLLLVFLTTTRVFTDTCISAYLRNAIESYLSGPQINQSGSMYPFFLLLVLLSRTALFADDLPLDMYPNSTRNLRLFVTSAGTYPFIYLWSFSRRPLPFTTFF